MKNLTETKFAELPIEQTSKKKIGKLALMVIKTILKGYSRPALVMLVAHVVKALSKDQQQAVEFCMEVTQQFDEDLDGQAD